ncbi:MAG: VacJ family lipoprotein [Betaproteobacteria bacterium]|nr:VacJ family lipoprotein [Betaproteobacteria bacterium]
MNLRWQRLCCVALVVLSGCATVQTPDARDPWESMNRSVFSFNDKLDRIVLKPVATVYRDVVPSFARKGVHNFFGNLSDIWSAVNNALAGRKQETGDSISRVFVNTTVGFLGLFDVATDLKIERHKADFGTTLARWGVKPGPYVVLPLLGPATLREVAALPVDYRANLTNQFSEAATRDTLTLLNLVDTRATYLGASKAVEGAALDSYSFIRDVYLQRQRYLQYDGDPPDEQQPADDEPGL